MHGIPILVKDSIATDPELGEKWRNPWYRYVACSCLIYCRRFAGMQTTAGSHALAGSIVPGDAAVVKNLRSAGAIILGKANLSELSGIRGDEIQGEWSGRGGYCYSAYVEDGDPEGSSSGSAVGVSAGFAAGSLGGDTTESITWPAGKAACYSLRPTLGLVPTAGCIPLAAKQDVIGPLGKSAHDVALMLSHMACDTSNVTMFGKSSAELVLGQRAEILRIIRSSGRRVACCSTHLFAYQRRLYDFHRSSKGKLQGEATGRAPGRYLCRSWRLGKVGVSLLPPGCFGKCDDRGLLLQLQGERRYRHSPGL